MRGKKSIGIQSRINSLGSPNPIVVEDFRLTHIPHLQRLREADHIDWPRATVDSSSVRAVGGGEKTGPNPTDRRKPGNKHHLLTDAHGIPLNGILTVANRHDVTQLLPLVATDPSVAGKPGRPKQHPESI